jgi:hypothetical protein
VVAGHGRVQESARAEESDSARGVLQLATGLAVTFFRRHVGPDRAPTVRRAPIFALAEMPELPE